MPRASVAFLVELVCVSAQNPAANTATPALGAAVDTEETDAAAALDALFALGVEAGTARNDLTVADLCLLAT